MKRNLLFLLMTLVLPIGACAYDAYINGIYYNFSGNEAEVTSSNNPGSYSGILVIPEFVGKDEKTYRVTSIGEEAFFVCRTLTSITIPNYLTHIGSGAFSGCKSLTEVHIKDMEAWCKITFGESHSNPLYYAKHLYMNGQEIKDLTIPDSIATINNYAFYNCSDLKTITLPGSITSIGHDAFYGCSMPLSSLPHSMCQQALLISIRHNRLGVALGISWHCQIIMITFITTMEARFL